MTRATPEEVEAIIECLGTLLYSTGPREFRIAGLLGEIQQGLELRRQTQRRLDLLEIAVADLAHPKPPEDLEVLDAEVVAVEYEDTQ
ncbi:hypothetical protein [Rhodococcus triatomae]|nr:hypothetical protein G419_25247 [Rhodococcus triatomae BKS 15-14]